MIGAIVGDIVGSIYEFDNHRSKVFPLFKKGCFATDDSIMTLAIAKALMHSDGDMELLSKNAVRYMREVGRPYPNCGYGGSFLRWMYSKNPKPYDSFGNGAAMRVSPVAYRSTSLQNALEMSDAVTRVTHNHPEGLKGARATTAAIWLALNGEKKCGIKSFIEHNYYKIDFTLDEIRDTYAWEVSCQGSVPQAIEAFLGADSVESAVRNAVSIGGDSDTIAAMAASMAEARFGVPETLRERILAFLEPELAEVVARFEERFPESRVLSKS